MYVCICMYLCKCINMLHGLLNCKTNLPLRVSVIISASTTYLVDSFLSSTALISLGLKY